MSVQKLWILKFSSNYDILLPILNTYTFDNDEFCLDVNCKGPEKPLSSLQFHLTLWDCNACMLEHLTEAYQNQVNLVLFIFGSNSQILKLYICVGSVSLGNGQQAFKTRPVNLKSGTSRTSLKRIPVSVELLDFCIGEMMSSINCW